VRHFNHLQSRASGGSDVPLTSFEKGKLKIAAHVREELELARIPFQSIQCKSGSLHIPPGVVRLIVTVDENPRHIDLATAEAEDCELLVAGETWRKIAAFIEGLRKA
jgi:hypothetical protein